MITNSTFILVTSIVAVVAVFFIFYFIGKISKKSKSRKEELERLRNTSVFSSDILEKYGQNSKFAIEQELKGNKTPIDKNNKTNLQQNTTNSVTYIEPFSESQITDDIVKDISKYKTIENITKTEQKNHENSQSHTVDSSVLPTDFNSNNSYVDSNTDSSDSSSSSFD